jgi:uncharacterized protein (TIGR03435 family)
MSKRFLTVSSKVCLVLAGVGGSSTTFGQDAPNRPAFEVASVKASAPDTSGGPAKGRAEEMMQEMQNDRLPGLLPKDRGHLMLRNRSLISLVATAYQVRTSQVFGPSWMSELRFDVEAKIPEGASPDDANAMLQSLLEERFGLRTHREDRNLPGYALLVGKNGPKLNVSDGVAKPLNIEEMKSRAEGQLKTMMAGANANGIGMMGGGMSRGFKRATSGTLAQGISQLMHSPVVDLTELTGQYDVDLVIPPPQDPADGIENRVAQAVDKLGLRLESRKVPVAALVVDNIAKTPTAN